MGLLGDEAQGKLSLVRLVIVQLLMQDWCMVLRRTYRRLENSICV
jgi:hypothetical protein